MAERIEFTRNYSDLCTNKCQVLPRMQEQQKTKIFCIGCGAQLKPGSKFCTECGEKQ